MSKIEIGSSEREVKQVRIVIGYGDGTSETISSTDKEITIESSSSFGPLIIEGGVDGDVSSDTAVTCKDVNGDVSAGTRVTCGDVNGDVNAGSEITCNDLTGDANAGGNITCGDIEGDASAGGNINKS